MVHPDAYGGMVFLADVQERDQPFAYLLYLFGVFFIRILQLLEGTCGIGIVARVDAYPFGIKRCHFRHFRIEVHIGY